MKESCPYHGATRKPDLCHECARLMRKGSNGQVQFELTDTISGVLERVETICPSTGRTKISFKVVGDLKAPDRSLDPWF